MALGWPTAVKRLTIGEITRKLPRARVPLTSGLAFLPLTRAVQAACAIRSVKSASAHVLPEVNTHVNMRSMR